MSQMTRDDMDQVAAEAMRRQTTKGFPERVEAADLLLFCPVCGWNGAVHAMPHDSRYNEGSQLLKRLMGERILCQMNNGRGWDGTGRCLTPMVLGEMASLVALSNVQRDHETEKRRLMTPKAARESFEEMSARRERAAAEREPLAVKKGMRVVDVINHLGPGVVVRGLDTGNKVGVKLDRDGHTYNYDPRYLDAE